VKFNLTYSLWKTESFGARLTPVVTAATEKGKTSQTRRNAGRNIWRVV